MGLPRPYLRRRRFTSRVHTYAKGSLPLRATKPSTEVSQSQPELGSTRSRSGRRDGAIRWILRSGYHRNACKQSERGVSESLIVSLRGRPASERSL